MQHNDKIQGVILSLLGAITVVLGAWGAHGLKPLISPEEYQRFEVGFFYQVFHLTVLLVIWSSHKASSRIRPWGYRFMGLVNLFFSGALYLMSARALLFFGSSFLGPLTPKRGLFFIVGWLLLGWGILKKKRG